MIQSLLMEHVYGSSEVYNLNIKQGVPKMHKKVSGYANERNLVILIIINKLYKNFTFYPKFMYHFCDFHYICILNIGFIIRTCNILIHIYD